MQNKYEHYYDQVNKELKIDFSGSKEDDLMDLISFMSSHSEIKSLICINVHHEAAFYVAHAIESSELNVLSITGHYHYDAIQALGKAIKNSKSLHTLSVSSEVGITYILNPLQNLTTLRSLSLCSERLNELDISNFAFALKKLTFLQSLSLSFSRITDKEVTYIADTIAQLPDLHSFSIHGNLGKQGATAISSALANHSLKHISLSGPRIDYYGLVEFFKMVKNFSNLESLSISTSYLFDEKIFKVFFDDISNLNNLRSLTITNSGMSDLTAITTAKLLALLPNVQFIYIDGDNISNECKEELSGILTERDPVKRANFAKTLIQVPTLIRLSAFAVQKHKETLDTSKLTEDLIPLIHKVKI